MNDIRAIHILKKITNWKWVWGWKKRWYKSWLQTSRLSALSEDDCQFGYCCRCCFCWWRLCFHNVCRCQGWKWMGVEASRSAVCSRVCRLELEIPSLFTHLFSSEWCFNYKWKRKCWQAISHVVMPFWIAASVFQLSHIFLKQSIGDAILFYPRHWEMNPQPNQYFVHQQRWPFDVSSIDKALRTLNKIHFCCRCTFS